MTEAILTIGADNSRKSLILDAAEAEFAEHGYDGVTLRRIAKRAEVDAALPIYYFKTKQGLFEAVFDRRAGILNSVRHKALDNCLTQSSDAPALNDLIEAYLQPLAEIQAFADDGWKHYFALVAWVNNSPKWGGQLMTQYFNPFVSRFIETLKSVFPEAEEDALLWGYQFMSGALTLTFADTRRLDKLSQGKASSADVQTGYRYMVPFIAAGIRQICDPDGKTGFNNSRPD